jgi:hypothetical protein
MDPDQLLKQGTSWFSSHTLEKEFRPFLTELFRALKDKQGNVVLSHMDKGKLAKVGAANISFHNAPEAADKEAEGGEGAAKKGEEAGGGQSREMAEGEFKAAKNGQTAKEKKAAHGRVGNNVGRQQPQNPAKGAQEEGGKGGEGKHGHYTRSVAGSQSIRGNHTAEGTGPETRRVRQRVMGGMQDAQGVQQAAAAAVPRLLPPPDGPKGTQQGAFGVEEKLQQQGPLTNGPRPAQQKLPPPTSLPSLGQDQYTILHDVLDDPDRYLRDAEWVIKEDNGVNSNISNGPKLHRTSDNKRKRVAVGVANSPAATELLATLVASQKHLASLNLPVALDKDKCPNSPGALFFDELTVLYSLPGCEAQAPHSDHHSGSALSIIIALQDDTYLWMWPRGPGVQGGLLEFQEISIPKGGAVVFAGNAFHCGAPYRNRNVRLHCYIESWGNERNIGQTYVCPHPPPSPLCVCV